MLERPWAVNLCIDSIQKCQLKPSSYVQMDTIMEKAVAIMTAVADAYCKGDIGIGDLFTLRDTLAEAEGLRSWTLRRCQTGVIRTRRNCQVERQQRQAMVSRVRVHVVPHRRSMGASQENGQKSSSLPRYFKSFLSFISGHYCDTANFRNELP